MENTNVVNFISTKIFYIASLSDDGTRRSLETFENNQECQSVYIACFSWHFFEQQFGNAKNMEYKNEVLRICLCCVV